MTVLRVSSRSFSKSACLAGDAKSKDARFLVVTDKVSPAALMIPVLAMVG
jgi:hypothetical protein